jgi:formate hydrogenlyase transcriptional activator
MLKIQRRTNGEVVFTVSGRLGGDNVGELSALLAPEPVGKPRVLDLKDLVLVDREIVRLVELHTEERTEATMATAIGSYSEVLPTRELLRATAAQPVPDTEAFALDEPIGVSGAFERVLRQVAQVGPTDAMVLITGETGTGKEVIARRLHAVSGRRQRALVVVNCAALPASLVESELFGHERGAFTGALQRRLGRFELAHGGTIFLDEVGELPLDVQAKLLRVLQEQEFDRVGGTSPVKVDVRVIAATNRPLERLVEEGRFRADLFYRLNVYQLALPPLRERREDIWVLADHFVRRFRARFAKPVRSIDEGSMEGLLAYGWPGNVRELEHAIERAVLLAEGAMLHIEVPGDRPPGGAAAGGAVALAAPVAVPLVSLAEQERQYIQEVLRRTGGQIGGKGGAAEILGLPTSTLRSRMTKLGLSGRAAR